jgi:hypothetical protein
MELQNNPKALDEKDKNDALLRIEYRIGQLLTKGNTSQSDILQLAELRNIYKQLKSKQLCKIAASSAISTK